MSQSLPDIDKSVSFFERTQTHKKQLSLTGDDGESKRSFLDFFALAGTGDETDDDELASVSFCSLADTVSTLMDGRTGDAYFKRERKKTSHVAPKNRNRLEIE